ncbi:MAG TPA: N-6 DNA methylase, partial [Myxococcaceae bacterium]|nr:N-6 DNA methylase [Myxococcaceae bacterium]
MNRAPSERLAPQDALSVLERRRFGRYFTPLELVDFTFERAARYLPRSARLAVIDPACGTGAFLSRARHFLPRASLFGLEIAPKLASICRAAVPSARILVGDALRGRTAALLGGLPAGAFELWIGNPPYNGTSALLKDKLVYRRVRALLPRAFTLPKGTSLRDDFAFFLLLAAARLSQKPGALAFVTSATLLDAFLYTPVRACLLSSLALREVVDLGRHVFEGTKVATCITLWTSDRGAQRMRANNHLAGGSLHANNSARFWRRTPSEPQPLRTVRLDAATVLLPRPPEYVLRPRRPSAEALDARWRSHGEELPRLVPVSFPALKTRFEELLVDQDTARLLRRLRAFVRTPPDSLAFFAAQHGIPVRCLDKLRRLRTSSEGLAIDARKVRPLLRYAGLRHRAGIPDTARAFCYLERRLIPRGDHRLRGDYDPHACPVKLVYNAHELPISAVLVDEPGCIHNHRHARFAPLCAPARLVGAGRCGAFAKGDLGPEVANLSRAGAALAERVGGARRVFEMIARFINSAEVQEIWAPTYAT